MGQWTRFDYPDIKKTRYTDNKSIQASTHKHIYKQTVTKETSTETQKYREMTHTDIQKQTHTNTNHHTNTSI